MTDSTHLGFRLVLLALAGAVIGDEVFLTGATGFIGGHVLDALLDAGYSVRALVRTPGRLHMRPGVTEVVGDVTRVRSPRRGHVRMPPARALRGPVLVLACPARADECHQCGRNRGHAGGGPDRGHRACRGDVELSDGRSRPAGTSRHGGRPRRPTRQVRLPRTPRSPPNAPPSHSPRPSPVSADRSDPVPDEIWEEAARHYDEKGLAAIILMIAITNLFNRVNITVRQPAGEATW